MIDWAESRDGGLTSVARREVEGGVSVLTLLTNGKFQGSNIGEVDAQRGFATVPLAHTSRRARALVIGYGTGATSNVLSEAGFEQIDIAELSADIVNLANRHFEPINGGVTRRPNVSLRITDGRNLLLLSRDLYDLISMEITSIWFRGAGAVYNREFYELARARLAPGGVMQQWVQIHHIEPRDVISIVATLRDVFEEVTLYLVGGQGVLIGCPTTCPRVGPLPRGAQVLLEPPGTNALLADVQAKGLPLDALVSTDDNMLLEHSTPKGNVLSAEKSTSAVLEALAPFGPSVTRR